jgi:cystathionine beta-lyase
MPTGSELDRLRAQSCIKWTAFPADVIPAWVADMDFAPAPAVVDAVRRLLDAGDLGYNFAAAARIPEVFVDRQERRFGWRPDVETVEAEYPWQPTVRGISLLCDVMQAVEVALWQYTEPGDGVVLLTPVYHPFFHAIEACGCRLVDVPLDMDGWTLDADRLEAAIDDRTRVILTCDPHNPTGRCFTRTELEAIALVAEKHDLLVISDEIWADLVFSGATHIPFASLSPQAEARTVTIAAASKAFNLAGMRCAVAHVGHAGLAEKLKALPGHVLGAVNSLGAEATLAAWTRGDEWLTDTLAALESNRDHLAARLSADLPEVGFVLPEATYLAWLDFSALGLGDDPAAALLERARVALSAGHDFGSQGAGFARLNFATHRTILDEIVDRIVAVVRA